MKNKLTKEKELEQLLAKQRELLDLHTSVRNRIQELEAEIEVPALKKKYVGKYYVYINSYGRGEKWPIYYHVIDINPDSRIIVNSFESMPQGEFRFNLKERITESVLEKRITSREYLSALRKFIKQCNLI